MIARSTLWRWEIKGVNGKKLSTIKLAGLSYVRSDVLLDFLTGLGVSPDPRPESLPKTEGSDEQDEADRLLKSEFGV